MGYTTNITQIEADSFIRKIVERDQSDGRKPELVKSSKRLFMWETYERGEEEEESPIACYSREGESTLK